MESLNFMENNFVENEKNILRFWEENKIFEKLKEKNKKGKPWSFLDGPITANNPMGVHHAWGRTLKDLFQRFKAMQGYNQRLQNGFDCQGLWLEVEVEKELGFKNKKDIEQYGIEKFVNKCKERAHKYSKIQTEQSIRLGMLRDWGDWQTEFDTKGEWLKQSHSYYTMSDENNYGIWHFLKECHKKKLLYKGRDVVPWCPRCGTAISQHEILTEEYKEITHQVAYVRFPFINQKNTYFLAWTTTPWTLPGNVALAVNPELIYVKVKDENGDDYIILKSKVGLVPGGKIIEIFEGKALENKKYIGLFDNLPAVFKALGSLNSENSRNRVPFTHKVVLWKDITAEEGTGIVHIAPGCGAEDFQLSKKLKFPVINVSNNESQYNVGFGDLTGKFVGSQEVRETILQSLRQKRLLFRAEDYIHRYPTCWRCKSELIFRLVDEWYISMDELRKPLMESVKKINWLPSFCKERELDWLVNMQDWLISKKRYWGLALPIWECQCGKFETLGSKKELQKRAKEGWQEFVGHSPHRPWIDRIQIKCSKCGKLSSRILDVGNVWLDAGITPFSTVSDDNRSEKIPYFNGNKREWQKWFPAELVCEGFPGQFKNWFYVLLVMSQVLENKPPFKNLLGFANVVDEKGEEMHKSKGNALWFDEGVEKIGADVMRWMYVKQNPADNMRFGYNVAKETERRILTLTNCVKFFKTYASEIPRNKKQETNKFQIANSKNILDKWIFSRLNNLIKTATEGLEKFDSSKTVLAIENFWINDLSLWYVRRSRTRLQSSENEVDKEIASQTLRYVLLTLCKLFSPMMPFLAETMYQELYRGLTPVKSVKVWPLSVHLCEYPQVDKKMIDKKLEQEMQVVREVVSLALAKRAEMGIGVRQPIAGLNLKSKIENLKSISKNLNLLELIKEEVNVKEIKFVDSLKNDIELDTTMTDELREEGTVREIIRYIQDLRKKAGLVPADRIVLHYSGDPGLVKVLLTNQKEILEKVKADSLKENNEKQGDFLQQKDVDLNGQKFWLAISNV